MLVSLTGGDVEQVGKIEKYDIGAVIKAIATDESNELGKVPGANI